MTTSRQRRRKQRQRNHQRGRSNQTHAAESLQSLRQRVTMEVARLANVLGMTMAVGECQGRDLWVFYGWGKKNGFLDYWPITGRWDVKGRVGGLEPDVRRVLQMAQRINNEREK